MKNIDREKIKTDYIENVYKLSWTYAKLTDKEKDKIINILYNIKLFGNNIKDLAYEMHCVYSAFLDALNYQPIGWRE